MGSWVRVSVTPCGFPGGRISVWVGFPHFLLPQILFHHFSTLISFVPFHFISPCDGATGVFGRQPYYYSQIFVASNPSTRPWIGHELRLLYKILTRLDNFPTSQQACDFHVEGLGHGCAKLLPLLLSPAAEWRLSYVFWAQRSTGLCADSTRCTQKRVHSARGKYIVRQWTSREAALRHSSGWGNWSVSPQYRDFRTRGLGRLILVNRWLIFQIVNHFLHLYEDVFFLWM